MKGASRTFLMLLGCLLVTSPICAGAQAEQQQRILVLNALREGAPVSDISERAFQKSLNERFAGRSDYYREYIDVARFPDDQYRSALYEFLGRKYQHQTFDLIITVARVAIDFVEQYGERLFPGTPV